MSIDFARKLLKLKSIAYIRAVYPDREYPHDLSIFRQNAFISAIPFRG